MKMFKPIAAVAAASLCLTGVGVGAASAEPTAKQEYVPASQIAAPGDAADKWAWETGVYNQWHFGPGGEKRVYEAGQARSGLSLQAGKETQIIKGNGNDVADLSDLKDWRSIKSLTRGLAIDADSTSKLFYQIGIRVDKNGDGRWVKGEDGFTTLRVPVDSASNPAAANWVLSAGEDLFGATKTDELDDLLMQLRSFDGTAYPISAGFLASNPATAVKVRSFTVSGTQTNFFEESKVAGASTEYVPGSAIVYDKNETSVYNVWHFGPDEGRLEKVSRQADDGIVFATGTEAQVIRGNGNDYQLTNDSLSLEDLIGSLAIDATPTDALTYQVGVRVDTDGDGTWEEGEGWTTLRAPVAAADGDWARSRGSFAKARVAPLDDLLTELGENAYPYSAGFLSSKPKSDVTVRSFTANGTTTYFRAPAAASTVKVSASASYNSTATAAVTVSGSADGTAAVTVAGKTYTAAVSKGKASVKLTGLLNAGSYKATVKFTSGNKFKFKDSSASTTVSIAKRTPAVSVKLASKSVSAKKQAKALVTVSVPGSLGATAKGQKVYVYDGSKKIASVTLNSKGQANVTLPKLKKGTHKIKATALKGTNTNEKSSSSATLKVS